MCNNIQIVPNTKKTCINKSTKKTINLIEPGLFFHEIKIKLSLIGKNIIKKYLSNYIRWIYWKGLRFFFY